METKKWIDSSYSAMDLVEKFLNDHHAKLTMGNIIGLCCVLLSVILSIVCKGVWDIFSFSLVTVVLINFWFMLVNRMSGLTSNLKLLKSGEYKTVEVSVENTPHRNVNDRMCTEHHVSFKENGTKLFCYVGPRYPVGTRVVLLIVYKKRFSKNAIPNIVCWYAIK